jgi:hypothetical protein
MASPPARCCRTQASGAALQAELRPQVGRHLARSTQPRCNHPAVRQRQLCVAPQALVQAPRPRSSWQRRCRRTPPACPSHRACCWPPWHPPWGELLSRSSAAARTAASSCWHRCTGPSGRVRPAPPAQAAGLAHGAVLPAGVHHSGHAQPLGQRRSAVPTTSCPCSRRCRCRPHALSLRPSCGGSGAGRPASSFRLRCPPCVAACLTL